MSETMPETDKRLTTFERLFEAWEAHCAEAGHKTQTDGGDATYSYSPHTERIWCNARGCQWMHSAAIAAATGDREP